jgi:HSP20 family protein
MSEELRNVNNYAEDGFLDPLFDAFMAIPLDGKKGNHLMKTDIEELGDKYLVNVDMPGVKKENIKVSSKNGYLNISYKQEENKDESNKHYVRKERYFGEANRSFYLGEVDASHIEAALNNGVLTISVPKVAKKDDGVNIAIK